MSTDVVCMALASVPQGEQRSRFLGKKIYCCHTYVIDGAAVISHILKFYFTFVLR